jgi:hypothetical protein
MGRKQKLFPLPLIVMMRYSATRAKKKEGLLCLWWGGRW